MSTTPSVTFAELASADLVVDQTYLGGTAGNVSDDPLAKLLPVGNQGGFRYKGSSKAGTVRLAVLYTTGGEADWPDLLDVHTGQFTYFGDNRSAGRELHHTQRQGNVLLRDVFEASYGDTKRRSGICPFLLFDKPGPGRAVRFRGLLAPGSERTGEQEELVAVWRATSGVRFQNYRALFTVLDVPTVSRIWINQILAGNPVGSACPDPWRSWVASRSFRPLLAPPTVTVRTRSQQLPATNGDQNLLAAVHTHFKPDPFKFEQFAADLWRASDRHVDRVDVTRAWRDGGRDAVGDYLLGPATDPVAVEFALEAKCYAPDNSVGVREVSRLISRLRHRQFGVLVTTSHVNSQAYREIREDGHPVVILAGADLVAILKAQSIDTPAKVRAQLENDYPLQAGAPT